MNHEFSYHHVSENQYRMQASQGVFCISLDFELHWGVFESVQLNEKGQQYFQNTRNAIPKMLNLFRSHDIQVTWAAVGMLFNSSGSEWLENKPLLLPTYSRKEASSYLWIVQYGLYEEDRFHFAPELLRKIKDTPGMEIGSHTYSHYYCQEPGQTPEQFRADLVKAVELASKMDITLRSLVFPRNQFNAAYLEVCKEMGINSVRSNPDKWYWDTSKPATITTKMMRTGDASFPINKDSVLPLQAINKQSNPMLLPASRLYKPWVKNPILNALKMRRILNEMTHAAKTGGYYHLWWHPHNLGHHPNECLKELSIILNHFSKLRNQYGFQSLNMENTRKYILSL